METRTVKDVSPHDFVKAYAAHLKRSGKMELPHWTDIVKTGRFKELAPYDPDWYYVRAGNQPSHGFYPSYFLGVILVMHPAGSGHYYIQPFKSDIHSFNSAASMARKMYLRQGIGVGGFQKIYGGRKRNGSRPPHFCKSSGAIARHILQQLQDMSIIEIDPRGGRKITSQGQRDLDQVAGRIVVVP